ncbi:MAG: Uma2 family endonuclease [Lachnospiraceae bacterium]|nr:Uma2 family endonuclease [Lachnospiraceae bacterium]
MTVEELRKRKKRLKLTTQQLALLAELPLGTVSKILTGETKNPSYLTIEKLEATIEKEEMLARVEAYQKAMHQYFLEHPEDEGNQKKFEEIYRKVNRLNDAPIPYAVPREEESAMYGSLALQDQRITINELSKMGESRDLQLIDGHLVVSEMAGVSHQRMVKRLGRSISDFVEKKQGTCEVFDVGVNVYLDEDEYTLVIPDIAVVCNPSQITERGVVGAPDWVIEVVSPSTRQNDYHKKLHKYMDAGVREYWIVDMDRRMVSVCINGEPMQVTIYSFDDEIPVHIYEGELCITVCK